MEAKRVTGWHVWYASGEHFTEADCEWVDLPQHGVLGVLTLFEDGTSRRASADDYYWRIGDVFGHTSKADQALHYFPQVKFGGWTTDEGVHESESAMTAAAEDHWKKVNGS